MKKLNHYSKAAVYFCISLLFFYVSAAYAADTIGSIAANINKSFEGVSKFMTGGAVIAGLGFAFAAILKFKAHRDNPQQVPLGAALALIFVAAALLVLPYFYQSLAATAFSGATVGTLGGTVIGQ